MTIPELLRRIAVSDELPGRWTVEQAREWNIDGATRADPVETTRIRYRDGEGWTDFGSIELTDPLTYTSDWIERIIVERDVPAAVLYPFIAIVNRGATIEVASKEGSRDGTPDNHD